MTLFEKMRKKDIYIKSDWAIYRTDLKQRKIFKITSEEEEEVPDTDVNFADALLEGEEITKEEYENLNKTQVDSSKNLTAREWLESLKEEFESSGLSIEIEKIDEEEDGIFTTILRPFQRKKK